MCQWHQGMCIKMNLQITWKKRLYIYNTHNFCQITLSCLAGFNNGVMPENQRLFKDLPEKPNKTQKHI